jgi:patatin-like phospholipase/acyl hydrolase
MLEGLMGRIQALEKLPSMPLPADYFDLIGGTSAGGSVLLVQNVAW